MIWIIFFCFPVVFAIPFDVKWDAASDSCIYVLLKCYACKEAAYLCEHWKKQLLNQMVNYDSVREQMYV